MDSTRQGGPTGPFAPRRPFLLALVGGGAATVGGLGVAARSGLLADDDAPGARGGRLQLSAGAAGVGSLDLVLDGERLAPVGPRRWRSPRMTTSPFSMVAFTWSRGQGEPDIAFRARIGGRWRAWQRVPHVHDAPDRGAGEDGDTVGTELVWTDRADGIELRVADHRPAGLALVLLHPGRLAGDREAAAPDPAEQGADAPDGRTTARTAATGVPRPLIRTRKEWGADESRRDEPPTYNTTIKQVHVHHTVNSNTYTRTDVPAMIRGMYAYHTGSLGWSDLGYNFLVDRFGRIWTGRAGGAGRPVRGAHTRGFNGASAGVAVIGNYETATPSRAVVGALARLAAWKLDRYGRDPQGRISVRSEGSDRYAAGRVVALPVVDGHRDTNDTACPGRNLYGALPTIRRRAAARIDRFAAAQ